MTTTTTTSTSTSSIQLFKLALSIMPPGNIMVWEQPAQTSLLSAQGVSYPYQIFVRPDASATTSDLYEKIVKEFQARGNVIRCFPHFSASDYPVGCFDLHILLTEKIDRNELEAMVNEVLTATGFDGHCKVAVILDVEKAAREIARADFESRANR